jgi:diadenosine tetraphosphate (Ap4A) HIT family hydrolase
MSEFSAELDGHTRDSHFSALYGGNPPSRVVAQTQHLAVLVDLSPLTEGHLLIVPRREVPAFADLDAPASADWDNLESQLRQRLTEEWRHPTIFEHGSSSKMHGSACITHAHLHLVPAALGLVARLADDGVQFLPVGGLDEVSEAIGPDRPYLYVQEPGSQGMVAAADLDQRPSQYLRRQAAQALGLDEPDWEVVVRHDLLRETVRRLGDLEVAA